MKSDDSVKYIKNGIDTQFIDKDIDFKHNQISGINKKNYSDTFSISSDLANSIQNVVQEANHFYIFQNNNETKNSKFIS